MNVIMTSDIDCFDEIMEIPEMIKNETVVKTLDTYKVVSPYIGQTNTFREYIVATDKVDTIDLVSMVMCVRYCINQINVQGCE